ncbi:MAG: sulfotransferase [Pseudomonadota bacterium]
MRATQYQRTPMRLLNSLLRGADAFGLARVTFDMQELLASARKRTGLTEFGDARFMEPMQVLADALNSEAMLNPLGRYLAKLNIERLLDGRLRAEALFRQHPEIRQRPLPDPIVIVGLARSGTTRLHRLLAADDTFLHLESWESVYPVPTEEAFQARDKGETDPRITQLDGALKAVLYMGPQIAAVHPLGTHEVEEEIGLLQYAFATQLFEIQTVIPSFAEWLMTHDQTHAYEYLADLLRLVSWFRGDPTDKPWLLKSPQHMQDLDALLRVFPGAKLICPHRDPIKVTGSCCSMAWNALVRDNDTLTPEWVGQEWLHKIERMLHKNLRDREHMCPAQNQHDVLYADISRDWETAIADVYEFLNLSLSPKARDGMRAWLQENRQHQHGAHRYALEDFGLDTTAVDERLNFYRQRFNIPYETHNPHLVDSRSHGEPSA